MVVDVKEKLDIWRYSRANFLIIFFLYNLLSISNDFMLCIDIYSVDSDNFSILCSAKAR